MDRFEHRAKTTRLVGQLVVDSTFFKLEFGCNTMICRYLVSSTLIAVLTSTLAAETTVFPEIYADTEAPGASGIWTDSSRGMTVYSSERFPNEPVFITEMAVRPDGAQPLGTHFGWDNLELLFSVTSTQPLNLSSNFATNIRNLVSEQVKLFDEEWIVTVDVPPVAGQSSREFEWRFPLDEPYLYNPADGNLLVDWVFGFPVSVPRGSFDTAGSPTSDHATIWAGDANSANGGGRFTVVTQFTFEPVPEPGFASMLFVPLIVLSHLFRRRRVD